MPCVYKFRASFRLYMKIRQYSANLIGLTQALAIALYCFLIASFISLMEKVKLTPEPFIIGMIMLILLVVSATICGIIVFGLPLLLILDKETKKALRILAFTILYLALFFILSLFILFLLN